MFFSGAALYAHANQSCYRCGRASDIVDMDAVIVGEGTLAICKGCIAEAAQVAGLTFNEAVVAELRSELATERVAREEAQKLEAELQLVINRLAHPKARRG